MTTVKSIDQMVRDALRGLQTQYEKHYEKEQDANKREGKLRQLARAVKKTENCLLNVPSNYKNLQGASLGVLSVVVQKVLNIFLRTNTEADGIYILPTPQGPVVYPHWSVLCELYKPYYKSITFEEHREPETGRILWITCRIVDNDGVVHTHTAAGADLPTRFEKWQDKTGMLKKHVLRQALAFTFPLVTARYGLEMMEADVLTDQVASSIRPEPMANSPIPAQAAFENGNPAHYQAVKTAYDELAAKRGRAFADEFVKSFRNERNLHHKAAFWPAEAVRDFLHFAEQYSLQSAEGQ